MPPLCCSRFGNAFPTPLTNKQQIKKNLVTFLLFVGLLMKLCCCQFCCWKYCCWNRSCWRWFHVWWKWDCKRLGLSVGCHKLFCGWFHKKDYANQMTNYMLWLMEWAETNVVLEQWYIDGVSCLTTHCKKQEFVREVFCNRSQRK